MKVADFKMFRYRLPLKAPLKLKGIILTERTGLLLKIIDENGVSAIGEIAPLPGFSSERLNQAASAANRLLDSLSGVELPENLAACNGAFEKLLGRIAPSVRFGIESALLELTAKQKGVEVCQLLSSQPRESVPINGLLTGNTEGILNKATELHDKGYKALKLKVGMRPLDDEIAITRQVRSAVGNAINLRLDANRAWNLEEAIYFCEAVANSGIEYLEEPLAEAGLLISVLEQGKLSLPIALDETLCEIGVDELVGFSGLKAIIIKPTFLGLEKAVQFACRANDLHITPVLSSSFESALGLSLLTQLSAALNRRDVPAGLDTISYFTDDVATFFPVKNGRITVSDLPGCDRLFASMPLEEATVNV